MVAFCPRQQHSVTPELSYQFLHLLNHGGTRVQLLDTGDMEPVRCSRCRAYLNPFVKLTHQGAKWTCNMCGMVNVFPTSYQPPVDYQGTLRIAYVAWQRAGKSGMAWEREGSGNHSLCRVFCLTAQCHCDDMRCSQSI